MKWNLGTCMPIDFNSNMLFDKIHQDAISPTLTSLIILLFHAHNGNLFKK